MIPITMFEGVTGYLVSESGAIYSVKSGKSKKLSTYLGKDGYMTAVMYSSNGKQVRRMVHKIVATTFLGPRADGMVCRHLDGNKLNNEIGNLAWGTVQENIDDIARHGNKYAGEKHYMVTIDDAEVERIKIAACNGQGLTELAKSFNVQKSHIFKYVTGESRANVRPDLTDKYLNTMKTTRTKVTPEQLAEAVKRVLGGESASKVATSIGRNKNYLSRILSGERRASS